MNQNHRGTPGHGDGSKRHHLTGGIQNSRDSRASQRRSSSMKRLGLLNRLLEIALIRSKMGQEDLSNK